WASTANSRACWHSGAASAPHCVAGHLRRWLHPAGAPRTNMLRADPVVVLKGVAKPSGTTRRFSLALGTLGARGRGLGTIPARGAHEGSWEVAERSQFNDDAPREDPPICTLVVVGVRGRAGVQIGRLCATEDGRDRRAICM